MEAHDSCQHMEEIAHQAAMLVRGLTECTNDDYTLCSLAGKDDIDSYCDGC